MKTFLLAALIATTSAAIAQMDNTSILQAIETRLQNKSDPVSSILTDEKYFHLHPDTRFRELIKKHCTSSPVKIAHEGEPGRKIRVRAMLTDDQSKPIAGAVVYFYQTDAKGWYAADQPHVGGNSGDQRHARLFGYAKTDASGKFEIHTVKPSGYPQSDLPAHIHVEVHDLALYRPLITEFLFDDDERLQGNIRSSAERNQFIIAKPTKAAAPFDQEFSYVVKLGKK